MERSQERELRRNRAGPAGKTITVIIAIALCLVFIFAFASIVLDSPETSTPTGPIVRKNPVPFGFKFYLFSTSPPTLWTDLTFQLSEGPNTTAWSNVTSLDLTGGKNVTWHYGQTKTLSNLTVWFNITDASGNGQVDALDSISFTTGSANRFSANTTYTLTILYEPTGGSYLSLAFQG